MTAKREIGEENYLMESLPKTLTPERCRHYSCRHIETCPSRSWWGRESSGCACRNYRNYANGFECNQLSFNVPISDLHVIVGRDEVAVLEPLNQRIRLTVDSARQLQLVLLIGHPIARCLHELRRNVNVERRRGIERVNRVAGATLIVTAVAVFHRCDL